MTTHDDTRELLRRIPQVDAFLARLETKRLETIFADRLVEGAIPRAFLKKAVRQTLAESREAILAGRLTDPAAVSPETLAAKFEAVLGRLLLPNFRRVVNGTGVVVHTNLGRSLLPESAMASLLQVGSRASNLEFDLATGRRGSRYSLVEDLLLDLTGAEAGLVVNNNAAAVLLCLETLAAGREVIVSRGQLVEIGGSFRIPDIMARSGARLVEVGATNRTHLKDYESAITDATALLLKVHTSNFKVIGFTSEVSLEELAALGGRQGIPVMEDLGSGCLFDLSRHGLLREPTVGEAIAAGADLVTFSGDKLLGGPQAGIILGRRGLIERIRKNPLNRALRIDKFTLAALEAVLRIACDEELAMRRIPTLAMLAQPASTVRKRAGALLRALRRKGVPAESLAVVPTEARVGGGAMPDQVLPSWAVAIQPADRAANELEQGLRAMPLPVIGRIEENRFLVDLRTVLDEEIHDAAESIGRHLLENTP